MRREQGYGAAMAGAAIGVLGGGGTTFLVALAFRPPSHEGWEDPGWSVYTMVACAAVALACGTGGIYVALRRIRAAGAGLTAAVFVIAGPLLRSAVPSPSQRRWQHDGWPSGSSTGETDPMPSRSGVHLR